MAAPLRWLRYEAAHFLPWIATLGAIALIAWLALRETDRDRVMREFAECRAAGGEFRQQKVKYQAFDTLLSSAVVNYCDVPRPAAAPAPEQP